MGYYGPPKLKVESKEPEDQEWFLHSLIEKKSTASDNHEAVLMSILDADYKKVKHRDKAFGNTLLHHAMQHGASEELVEYLLEEWPDAAKEIQDPANDHVSATAKPNYRWYPLHLGAISGAPLATMKMVLEAYPEAAQKADTLDGSLPLHLCIGRHTDAAVLQLLLEAYPKGAEALTANKELALHKAIARAKPAVVKALLQAFPRGVKLRTYPLDQMTPLEMARDRLKYCKVGTPEEAQEILDAVQETKKKVDADFKAYVKTIGKHS
ncbi:hypothetical protein AB1Y20_019799 [Prymnesium parvum]|uniref:Uncharacterized protein n=1 Tax=Prymnesium parvum TaxID=97485 RepID=A0AB34JVG9_PRYPA